MIGTNIAHYNIDGLVKSLKRPFSVIPAEAGVQNSLNLLDSRFRGNDKKERDKGVKYE